MTIDEAIEFAEDINATVTFPSEEKLDEEFFANIPDWLEELKTLRYCKDKWNENQYQQGKSDAINAIKNDLHERLTEEMNSPYQDQSLCQGLYYAIQRCDWFLSDDKEHNNG